MGTVIVRTAADILALLADRVAKTGDTMSGSLTIENGKFRAGTLTDILGSALEVFRNGTQVGRIDNNGSNLRVQAQNGVLQLRGPGNNGITIDGSGIVNIDNSLTIQGSPLTGGGWWTNIPLPPATPGSANTRSTGPLVAGATDLKGFATLTGPMFMPGAATYDRIGIRTGVAAAAGQVGSVYKENHTPGQLPNRANATLVTTLPVDVANRSEIVLGSPLAVPANGAWFWFEGTDPTVTIRCGRQVLANANWSSNGSLDATGTLPVAGADATNSDLGKVYVPLIFFRRSA